MRVRAPARRVRRRGEAGRDESGQHQRAEYPACHRLPPGTRVDAAFIPTGVLALTPCVRQWCSGVSARHDDADPHRDRPAPVVDVHVRARRVLALVGQRHRRPPRGVPDDRPAGAGGPSTEATAGLADVARTRLSGLPSASKAPSALATCHVSGFDEPVVRYEASARPHRVRRHPRRDRAVARRLVDAQPQRARIEDSALGVEPPLGLGRATAGHGARSTARASRARRRSCRAPWSTSRSTRSGSGSGWSRTS